MLDLIWVVPVAPLASFAILGIFGKDFPKKLVSWLGCGSVGISFLFALGAFSLLLQLPTEQRHVIKHLFTWIASGDFQVKFALQVDPLSAVMMLVVTGVGFLIHVYSIGYMGHDPGYQRFFAYLNLFMFSMLTLVLANNFLLLFVGWEGVGLCSYLLIGFWYERPKAAAAGVKAFVVNRIGDFGFLLGMILIFWTFGSLNFDVVFTLAPLLFNVGAGVITAITLLLFLGAVGKSAQIPLYVWLPDAMEGPTPVSALIHAATMVTAGVYMVARCHVLYQLAPVALEVVAVIGAVTALYAATIGLVQNDIKRVLAYSTISQLGYMFLACGVGAFAAGIFHLMTHAFFKALLFLGAGSVIHALSGEQDMRWMGGLRKSLPRTTWTFLMGTLAIAGVPLFSGFFSKDEILWQAYSSPFGSPVFWLLGVLGAICTAFYMFRLFFLTFSGSNRSPEEVKHHIHESPRSMTLPLTILAVLSVIGGYIGLPQIFGGANRFGQFLEPVFGNGGGEAVAHPASLEWLLLAVSATAIFLSIYLAYSFYIRNPLRAEKVKTAFAWPYQVLFNKYFVDEIYNATIVRPLVEGSQRIYQKFDLAVIDGAANGSAKVVGLFSALYRRVQTGNARNYALSVVLGTIVLIGYLLLR